MTIVMVSLYLYPLQLCSVSTAAKCDIISFSIALFYTQFSSVIYLNLISVNFPFWVLTDVVSGGKLASVKGLANSNFDILARELDCSNFVERWSLLCR